MRTPHITYLYDCSFLLAVTQDVVNSISSNLDDVGNKIIDTMEGTVEALQSAEMTGNNKIYLDKIKIKINEKSVISTNIVIFHR